MSESSCVFHRRGLYLFIDFCEELECGDPMDVDHAIDDEYVEIRVQLKHGISHGFEGVVDELDEVCFEDRLELCCAPNRHELVVLTVINAIDATSTLCKDFPTQPPQEQRRALKLLVEKATWKDGRLETTLRNPFQKLRVSNHATATKQRKDGNGGAEMENWLNSPLTQDRPVG